jgi:molybdenum cofactor cytidylyltransferase
LVHRLGELKIQWLRCGRATEGMGGTLAEGVGHIPGWSGVLVALADMPWIAPSTYLAVAERLSAERIVVPVWNGQRGHPVGFGCHFFAALSGLNGDTGARQLLTMHAQSITELTVADPAIHRDIDVPADMPLPD